jgi:hypothetical protein
MDGVTMSKKKETADLTKLSMEELAQQQEEIDTERKEALEAVRARGRVIKAEIERRNMEETILSKLRSGQTMREGLTDYFKKLPKAERTRIAKQASKEAAERAQKAVDLAGGEE